MSSAAGAAPAPGRLASALASGVAGVREALVRWRTWLMLGWYDFQLAHRRAAIGPLWEIAQVAIWVIGLTLVFRSTLAASYPNYLAYVAAGVIVWNFASMCLSNGAQAFVQNAVLIRNINNPLLIYPWRIVVNNLAKLVFQFPVFLLVLPWSAVTPGPAMLLALPGLLLLILTAAWAAPLMGLLGVRYRDTAFAVSSAMRFLFFASPVFWIADGLGSRAFLATWNPLTHYLEIVRAPLLGEVPALASWLVVGGITAAGALVTLAVFGRYRREIVFWL